MEISENRKVTVNIDTDTKQALKKAGIDCLMLSAHSEDYSYNVHVIANVGNLADSTAEVHIKLH